jgi:hypothetical protein
MRDILPSLIRLTGVASLVAVLCVQAVPQSEALATTNVAVLLAVAEHDTNTVKTLIHRDKRSITAPNVIVSLTATGQEDETHNREQDHQSVNVRVKPPTGKPQKIHYVEDVIFVDGKTYYRVVPGSPTWKSRKGTTFHDPYTGGWNRGRTTVTFSKSVKFQEVGIESGKTHLRAQESTKTFSGSVDLWISGGSKPYVVRELDVGTSKSGSQTLALRTDMNLGPFNKTLVILPPTSSGAA